VTNGHWLVVLLHGFPQTAACWTEVTEALAAAGYRVLAPDQRGYSPGPGRPPGREGRWRSAVQEAAPGEYQLGLPERARR
jgi:pimeloyl-ACP methyl ester carboxylesterase